MLLKRTKSLVATLFYALILAVPLMALVPAAVSYAAPVTCVDGTVVQVPTGESQEVVNSVCNDHGGRQGATGTGSTANSTPATAKNDCQGDAIQAGASEESGNHCAILDYIQLFINVLSGAVGIVIVGSIIYAGIEYTMSGSDAQKVSNAKNRIRNAIIALVTYLFFYSFLQWLIPGGVF